MVVDGSKFKAVNSRNNNYNVDSLNEKIKKIENKIEEYIGELNRNDILENAPSENSKEELKKIISELSEKKAIYEKYLYEQAVQEINSKIEITQVQDKNLELRLKQLDTEHNAIQTEIDAVKKVIEKNTESSFKTFG